MNQLQDFIGERKTGYVFWDEKITSKCSPIRSTTVRTFYSKAWKIGTSGKFMPKGITHTLRSSAISELKKQGISSEEIQKITGHKRLELINYYDQSNVHSTITQNIILPPLL